MARLFPLLLGAWLAGCAAWSIAPGTGAHRDLRAGPEELPRAALLLDRRIELAESDRRAGSLSASQLAHLRMTRSARDLIERHEVERALDLLERAIALDGSEGFGYLYLARAHLGEGRYEQGNAFLGRAQALLPPDAALAREIKALRVWGLERASGAGLGS